MLTVITGPPCAGKTTYLREHAQPGDIRIDFDAIAQTLGSSASHDHPEHIKRVTMAARHAAIAEAIRQHRHGRTAWIIDGKPSAVRLREYEKEGASVITLSADLAELHRRASQERPALWHQLIDEWDTSPATRIRRGWASGQPRSKHRAGRPYRRARAQMFAIYGTVCHLCGHGGATTADHLVPISVDGAQPVDPHGMRPAHGVRGCPVCGRRCNQERGNKAGGIYRPAVDW